MVNENNSEALLGEEQELGLKPTKSKTKSKKWKTLRRRISGSPSPPLSPIMPYTSISTPEVITQDTPFEQLVWMGPHNTLILEKQMCGRIGYDTVDTTLGYLNLFPVCIEIDICGKSKIISNPTTTDQAENEASLLKSGEDSQQNLGIYVDHFSKVGLFENGQKITRTGVYSSDQKYDQALSNAFSIEAVFTHINQKYEEQHQTGQLFPLMLSMDVSKISKRSDKLSIFAYIEATFQRVFETKGGTFQGSAATQPLRNLMGKVLLRIDNVYGNVPKPHGASEKLNVKYDSGTDAIIFEGLKTANKPTHFTRVYPPVFADMTIPEAIKTAIRIKMLGLRPSRSPSSSPKSPSQSPHFFPNVNADSLEHEKTEPNITPEMFEEFVEEGEFDPFRQKCPETEHSRYTAISEEMVKLLIGYAEIFENVNCVAFNWHDLTKKSKDDVVKHFTERYQGVVVSMSGATAHEAGQLPTPPPSPSANLGGFADFNQFGKAGGGKKRRKLKSRTKPKNKLIRKTRLIKRGGAKTNRRVLKSKKNRKSIKNKRSKKNKSIKIL